MSAVLRTIKIFQIENKTQELKIESNATKMQQKERNPFYSCSISAHVNKTKNQVKFA